MRIWPASQVPPFVTLREMNPLAFCVLSLRLILLLPLFLHDPVEFKVHGESLPIEQLTEQPAYKLIIRFFFEF